jgi:hypothetical protein
VGYDDLMSDSTPESESGTTQETPDQGLISDEQLPDDLRPDKNPMAKEPDDSEGGVAAAPSAPGGPQDSGGAPDAGQPG